jgi:hypothetical protein
MAPNEQPARLSRRSFLGVSAAGGPRRCSAAWLPAPRPRGLPRRGQVWRPAAGVAARPGWADIGTTLAAPASPGNTVVHVVTVADTNSGVATYVGDPITIDTGSAEEVRTIIAVGSSAAPATITVAPLQPGDRAVYLANVNGVTIGHPLMIGTGPATEIASSIVSVGAQTMVTLADAAAAGDQTVTVLTATGPQTGHLLSLGTGSDMETRTIESIGRPGTTGTVVTLSAALGQAHPAGAPAVDIGTGVILSGPVRSAHPAGTAAQDLGSGITLSAPLQKAHPIGAPARDAGSGLVLTRPLRRNHATGSPVITPGTGITLLGKAAGMTPPPPGEQPPSSLRQP